MTTATVHAKQTTRPASITLDSWNNILFLVQEPDRHGSTVWNVRLSLGDLPPWRYGPFDTKKAAREAFSTLVAYVDGQLSEMCCEAGNRAECVGNEEY
jgi:hypothetical protein